MVPPSPLCRQRRKTVCFASSSLSAQQIRTCPYRGPSPPASRYCWTVSSLGSVETSASPARPASSAAFGRAAAIAIGIGCSGERVEPRVVEGVVPAPMGLFPALPEEADHLDRLLEHLDSLVGRGPARAGDVLVQVLACTEAEREPAGQHRADGRRGLSHDRRMRSDQRAGDAGGELESLRRLRDPAEHAPDEWALALGVDPGVEVVGDHREGEAQLLRPRGGANEVERCVLLGREPIAELRHGALGTARLHSRNPQARMQTATPRRPPSLIGTGSRRARSVSS